jgi:hypothetical protein
VTGVLYSFDTSVLINGRRDLLPPDVFPTPWALIEQMIVTGSIRAVDVVRDELAKKDDTTKIWAEAQVDLFVPLEGDIQVATTRTLAAHPRLIGRGGARNAADPFVIGLARARSGVVVTEETRTSNPTSNPRIPDVCNALGVRCVNLVGFIREQGWRF